MFDEPTESPQEHSSDPAQRAREKADEFRTHAERAAVFEGTRKFEAQILTRLDADVAREIQRTMGRLEKAKAPESPILLSAAVDDAAKLLNLWREKNLSTNDYHIHRRPGEVMIVRWLAGEQVETFYERLQAHFDAALGGHKEDERQSHEWKQDAAADAYFAALDAIEVKMAERYLRDLIRQHNLFVLSTQSADEIDILYLSDYLMSVSAAEIVGEASAPPAGEATEQDRAWFFKLFSLRGMNEGVEQMCFFTYLQKSDEMF
jgi:hypothetical protein